jgi:hypothetical protein
MLNCSGGRFPAITLWLGEAPVDPPWPGLSFFAPVTEIEREISASDQDQVVLVARFTENIEPYLVGVV